jgi:GTP-binding protein HflX
VVTADIIVHVRDVSHPDTDAQAEDVAAVLAGIGASGPDAAPIVEAWNKLDLLDGERRDALLAEAARRDDVVPISALSGEGVDTLRDALSARLTRGARVHHVELASADGAAIAWLHRHGEVLAREDAGETVRIDVRIGETDWARFAARE